MPAGTNLRDDIDRTFPGEVIDNIIDHLYNDVSTLKTGASVCRAWLPSCRYHLFHTTVCYPTIPGKTHLDLLQWSRAYPEVAAYVVRLCIEGTVNVEELPRGPEVAVEDIEHLLALLPSVEELIVRGICLSSQLSRDDIYLPCAPPRRVRELAVTVGSTRDFSFVPMYHLLLLLSDITSLTICDVQFEWEPSFEHSPLLVALCSSMHIECLHLQCERVDRSWSGYRGILQLFHCAQPRWRLRSLVLRLPRMTLEDSPDELLADCTESLEDLSLIPNATIAQLARDEHADYLGTSFAFDVGEAIHN